MEQVKKYPVTSSLIIMSVCIYVVSVLKYGLTMSAHEGMEMGAFNPLLVLIYGEYYRIITANFLHFGVIHVAINCYSLYNVGTLLERMIGMKNILVVVIVSAVTTSLWPLLSFLVFGNGANVVLAGISGIVCGLVGALFVVSYQYKEYLGNIHRSITKNIFFMILISVSLSGVSLSGHLGGLIGGMITMYIVLKNRNKKIKKSS